MLVRAGELVSRQCLEFLSDGREVHAMPNKAWHVCGRPRDGERAVSRERPASYGERYQIFPLPQHLVLR